MRGHHERRDGSGYPDGLRGGELPLEARILGAGDVDHALTSERVYRRAYASRRPGAILDRGRGGCSIPACWLRSRASRRR